MMRLGFEEKEEEEEVDGNGDTIPRVSNGEALYLSMEAVNNESFAFSFLSSLYFNVGLYIGKKPILLRPGNQAQKVKIIERFCRAIITEDLPTKKKLDISLIDFFF